VIDPWLSICLTSSHASFKLQLVLVTLLFESGSG
jgi:hypothetical protein